MFRKKKIIEMRTVLFVDDDEAILRSLERGLLDELYNQLFAKSGEEALEILKREEVHVIVTDMLMPGMDGVELLKNVREMYPHIIMIILSGYAKEAALQTTVEQGGIFKLVPKPWKLRGNFEKLIRRAVAQYNLQNERETVRQKN